MIRATVAALALASCVGQVSANVLNISSTNGVHSASASFAFSNSGGQNRLDITLTNTMTTNAGPNWLNGLFFDIAGSPQLTNADTAGSMITLNGTTQTPYNTVTTDHFWAFRDDVYQGGALQNQQYGLGAAGLGIFGPSDIINFQAGGPGPQPAGSDGGIVANIAGLTVPPGHQGRPFVLGSLVFSFFLPINFDVNNASVDNVAFVFGTSLSEVVLPPDSPPVVPVPLALPMAMIGLVGVATMRKRFAGSK